MPELDNNYDMSDTIYDPRIPLGDKYILPVRFGIEMLDIFCSYSMDIDNENIPHGALENTKILFDILDTRPYMNNDSLMARIEFIKLVLYARINLNLDKKSLILQHIHMNAASNIIDVIDNEIIKGPAKIKLQPDVIKYINSLVYEHLSEGYSVIYNQKLMDLYDKKESGYYKTMADYTADFKKLMREISISIQNIEKYKREGKGFDLSENTIIREAKAIKKELSKPSNKLKTGIQYLNRMLNGGFESGRSYLFMGLTGVGKSIVLLSIANWIRKYNKLPKKNDMKQAVLFISQENSKNETFERLFNMNTNQDDLRTLSDEEFVDRIKESGLIAGKDDINLIFKEYSDKEIGVSDIDGIIDDLERQGIEVVAVVQDYIEKLKPKQNYPELRHVLGSNATELSELAKKRQIPVISAAQLNRMASTIVDSAIANNKMNTTKLLGRAQASESFQMIMNIDCVVIINREIDDTSDTEKQYLGFKLEKFRGKPNNDRIIVFLHPFDQENGILLIPDIDTKPLSRLRMEDFEPMRHPQPAQTQIKFEPMTDFKSSFIDIIDDDYKDTDKHYLEIMEQSKKTTARLRQLQERERQLKKQREKELAGIGLVIIPPRNGPIIISKREWIYYDNGIRIISPRKEIG